MLFCCSSRKVRLCWNAPRALFSSVWWQWDAQGCCYDWPGLEEWWSDGLASALKLILTNSKLQAEDQRYNILMSQLPQLYFLNFLFMQVPYILAINMLTFPQLFFSSIFLKLKIYLRFVHKIEMLSKYADRNKSSIMHFIILCKELFLSEANKVMILYPF